MTDGTAIPDDPRPTRGRHRSRRPGRWLIAGGATVLAAALGLTLALRAGATPACAAVPPAGVVQQVAAPPAGKAQQGKATFYDSNGAGGNCSYPSAPANRLYVALGPSEYSAGAACGGYLDVTGPKGSVRVLVMDQCPECAPGHIDLSREAFARIADPVQGIVPVTYRAVVNPPLPGPLTFRIKEGASQWWFAVLVANHGNPLRTVEVRQSGGWRAADRQDYNYWVIPSGAGPGPYAIRVTDAQGHRVTATGIRLAPGQVQRADVRMYGGTAPASVARSAIPSRRPATTPPATASPVPTRSSPPALPSATRNLAVAPVAVASATAGGCAN